MHKLCTERVSDSRKSSMRKMGIFLIATIETRSKRPTHVFHYIPLRLLQNRIVRRRRINMKVMVCCSPDKLLTNRGVLPTGTWVPSARSRAVNSSIGQLGEELKIKGSLLLFSFRGTESGHLPRSCSSRKRLICLARQQTEE